MAPLGKGQRGLINASPRSGKTVLLKDIAKDLVGRPADEILAALKG